LWLAANQYGDSQEYLKIFDLHVHTVRGSSDSSLTPEQLIEEAQRIGLDGVCLTEHGGGWEAPDLEATFRDAGLTVIRALEVDTDMGHILAFGLHHHVSGMNDAVELRKAVDMARGVMISAHPFRNLFNKPPYNLNLLFKNSEGNPGTAEEASAHPVFQLVDDIEVANGSNTDQENLFALDVAARLGLGGTGGSDVHSNNGLGKCITIFDGDVRGESDLIEALKAKAFTPGQNLHKGDLKPFSL